jgi:hypothetical protein
VFHLPSGQFAPLFAFLLLTMGMPSPHLEPVRWEPDASGRWARASDAVGPVPYSAIDLSRSVVIPRCLDQIARATERMSGIADEITLRNTRF